MLHFVSLESWAPRILLCKGVIGLNAHSFHEHIDAIDFQVKTFRYSEFGIDSLGNIRRFIDTTDIQILPDFVHDNRVRQIGNRDTQFVGHVLFGCIDSHTPVQLHTRYQISGSS